MPASPGARSAATCRPTSGFRLTSTPTNRTRSTWSPSKATRKTIRQTEGCASIAAGMAGTNGRPSPRACRRATAISTCCATPWRWMRWILPACTSGRLVGRSMPPRMRGTAGRPSSGIFRPCSPSKSKRCNDSSRAAGTSAQAGPGRRRGAARCSSTTNPAFGAGRAGDFLSDVAGNDPRSRQQGTSTVHQVLRLRAGSVPRSAGYAATRGGGKGDGAVSGGRGGRGRLGRQEPAEPFAGERCDLLEGARFLEEVCRAGDDDEPLDPGQRIERLAIEVDDDVVGPADNQQRRLLNPGQHRDRQVRTPTSRDDRADHLRAIGGGNQGGRGAGRRAEVPDRQG